MTDEKLYNEIQDNQAEKKHSPAETDSSQVTWLLFSAGGKTFAIDSVLIKEILQDTETYKLPFVPSFITGILNFYGKPYAVADFAQLQDLPSAKKKIFLILETTEDYALQVDDIYDFYSSQDIVEQPLMNQIDCGYFSKIITSNDISAPVLDVEKITGKIRENID